MSSYRKDSLKVGMEIPKEKILLPTGGAVITAVDFVKDGEGMVKWPTGDFIRVSGVIHPADPSAYDIMFMMGLPLEWNEKLLQYGGGGLDGVVMPVEMPFPGRSFFTPPPMMDGYVVAGCDGGHQIDSENSFDCSWGLNDEAMENYAYKAQKKMYDVAREIVQTAYGRKPERAYYAGGSNGGRECLKSLEQFPEDYDGAICLYPVQHFIGKVLFDSHYGTALQELGDEAIISPEQWAKIQKKIIAFSDQADGAEDGIISDIAYAKAHRAEMRAMLSEELNEKQLAFLDVLAAPLELPFDMGYGTSVVDGYAVYEGAPVYEYVNDFPFVNVYGSSAASRDTLSIAGADGIIRTMVMRDMDFDVLHMDYNEMKDELRAASRLFDVSSASLDAFKAKGGKIILLQGLADPLVSPYATFRYYERLVEHYDREELYDMMRFYIVPGYGHGMGNNFGSDVDLLTALDKWVSEGESPKTLIAADGNDQVNHRTRPIYEYPYIPIYNGEGDINQAESFHPGKMDIEEETI